MTPAEFRAARLALGYSVKEMAEALGVTAGHVRQLETPEDRKRHRRVTLTIQRLVKMLSDTQKPPPVARGGIAPHDG